jgi:alcohol dehydrogenase
MSLSEVDAFRSYLPVRVSYGDGVIGELPDVLRQLSATRALVVYEEPIDRIRSVMAALDAAAGAGVAVETFLKGAGEPTVSMADDASTAIAESGAQAVVGIGGGSALDLAKACRVIAQQGGPATRYLDGAPIESQRTPLVLAPTTSGTGSEVSGAAVLTDKARGRKAAFGSPLMRADHALVDPLLTLGLPPGPTAQCGIDALAQSLGGVIVRISNPLSIAVGLEGCRHAAAGLVRAVRDGSDVDARRHMSLASLLGGLAMNLSDPAADHALGHAMGSLAGLPHGLTIGLALPHTLEVSRADAVGRLERVADALDEPDDGSADGSRAVRAVLRLLAEVGFPTAADVGLHNEHLDDLTRLALGEQAYFFEVDPHDWTENDVRQALRDAIALAAR